MATLAPAHDDGQQRYSGHGANLLVRKSLHVGEGVARSVDRANSAFFQIRFPSSALRVRSAST